MPGRAARLPLSVQTKAKIALTVALLGSAGFLAASSLGTTQHYKMVDELGELSQWTDKAMMVHGTVVPGSIREEVVAQDTQRTFLLEHGGKRVRVFSAGPKPDVFKDLSDVIAVGAIVPAEKKTALAASLGVTVDSAYVVDASELRAKCPTRYEGAQGNKKTSKLEW
jgi:cytochrome c-type biogenesis protein CcmE